MNIERALKEAERIHEIAREFEKLNMIEEVAFPFVVGLAAIVSLTIIFVVL